MASLSKVFTFDTTADGWVFTSLDSGTGAYVSGDGNAAGSLNIDNAGRNANDTTSYWEWTGTFEDLGIASGDTVDGYSLSSLEWKCTVFNTVDALTSGAFTINDGTLRTLVAGASITSTTGTFTAANQSGSVSGLSLPSDTAITLRVTCDSDCGNNAQAQTTILLDNITVGIDYTAAVSSTDVPLATLQTVDRGVGQLPAARIGGVIE